MAERTPDHVTRPRPGPRPRSTEHGVIRRRVGVSSRTAPRPARRTPRSSERIEGPGTTDTRPTLSGAAKFRWFLVVLFVAVAAFVVALLQAPTFEVQTVQISGAARTSEGAILDALSISDGQALLTYDTQSGREATSELPWVAAVSLTRQWPSTLRVVVRERAVSAAVARPSGDEWVVLAGDGVVVEHRMTPPSGVPLIVATNGVVEASVIGEPLAGVDRALAIARDLPLQLDPWITTWSSNADGVVTAELVGSAQVSFGTHDDHRTQFVSLASILNGGTSLVCLEVIDLTIADTPVLHRDASCLIQSAEMG